MEKHKVIKVGFCVAYDWEMLKISLPIVYEKADLICLSIDKNRRGWSGLPYTINEEEFRDFIERIDRDKKIDLYEDDFSIPNLTSIENDNRQRQMMASRMESGGWHVQIDSDEYFLNFEGFVEYLLSLNRNPTGKEKPFNVTCNTISIFKKNQNGFFIVNNSELDWESVPFATSCPSYTSARRNSHFNHQSPFFVVHESWARTEEQLRHKIDSWGHDNDFIDKESYFRFWKELNETNYALAIDFHPLKPVVWHKLDFISGTDVNILIQNLRHNPIYRINKLKLYLSNSRNVHRVKKLWSMLFG